jgi:hypothetical protein
MHIRKITVCVRDTTWFVELIAGLQQSKSMTKGNGKLHCIS